MTVVKSSLEQQLQDQKRINAALQHELHWLYDTIYNPSFNETDIRLMCEITPWGVKAQVISPDEASEQKLYYPALAAKAHCSEDVASKHVRALANKADAFAYRRIDSHDTETGEDISRVVITPKAPSATPNIIDLERAKRGGSVWKDGKRVKRCPSCDSPVILRRSQYWCQNPECNHTWEDEQWKPVNNTDDMPAEEDEEANRHIDGLVPEQETNCDSETQLEEANRHIDGLVNEEQEQPIATGPVYTRIDPTFEHFADPPDFLRQKCIWTCGRAEWNEQEEKFDKMPYIADLRGTKRAKSNDRATWKSYEEAKAVYDRSQNWTGKVTPFDFLMFMCDGTFTFLDQDHCRNLETGEIDPVALERARQINSYTETSWSGDGIHTYAIGTLPPGRRKIGGIEMYDQKRPCVYTGKPIADFPAQLEARQAEIAALHAQIFPTVSETTWRPAEDDIQRSDEELEQLQVDMLASIARSKHVDYREHFMRLWNGDTSDHPSPSEADAALCYMLKFWGKCVSTVDWLYRNSGLYREKWERADYRERTLAYAFREAVSA